MCLGYARGKGLARELWLTLDDALRHMLLLATTGSGKTEALLSVFLNSICWGRGICYSDGKGQNTLAFAMWSLARRFGREDDFYVLNFMTGGQTSYCNCCSTIRNGNHQTPSICSEPLTPPLSSN